MFKRVVAVLLVVLMLSTSMVYAEEREYTVYDLARYMEIYNGNLKISDMNLKKMDIDLFYAQINAKEAKVDYDKAKKDGWAAGPSFHYGYQLQIDHVLPLVEHGHYATKRGLEQTRRVLQNNLHLLIMDTYSKQEAFELNELKLAHAKSKYEDAKLKKNLGLISSLDLLKEESAMLSVESTLNKSERAYIDSIETLNNLIGFDLNERYKIKIDEMTRYEFQTYDELIEKAKANNFGLQSQIMQRDNLKNKLDFISEGNFAPFVSGLKDQVEKDERTLASYNLKIQDLEAGVEKDLMVGLESLKNLSSSYDKLANSITVQEKNLEAMKVQNKQGLVTDKQMKDLEFAIMDMKTNLEVLGYNYNNKVISILYFIEVGSTIN